MLERAQRFLTDTKNKSACQTGRRGVLLLAQQDVSCVCLLKQDSSSSRFVTHWHTFDSLMFKIGHQTSVLSVMEMLSAWLYTRLFWRFASRSFPAPVKEILLFPIRLLSLWQASIILPTTYHNNTNYFHPIRHRMLRHYPFHTVCTSTDLPSLT